MIDTSVLVAGLVDFHEFHERSLPDVVRSVDVGLAGIVIAETWSALRRAPWNLDARTVARQLAPWREAGNVRETPATLYDIVLREGPELHLGGNVHDYLIALTCHHHGTELVTLDRRQAYLAANRGIRVRLLLDA